MVSIGSGDWKLYEYGYADQQKDEFDSDVMANFSSKFYKSKLIFKINF